MYFVFKMICQAGNSNCQKVQTLQCKRLKGSKELFLQYWHDVLTKKALTKVGSMNCISKLGVVKR